ncbi:MAG: peroxiredoxin [Candidatus Sedimenticola endophacoides]|uniref:thioredoxin-dependent peroxiredoxin n=1 Tax=Candidatus Sedimenticola endophacoides TaxID=2548426 RepID=A0A657Q1D2_9GAMM|nr:MAG: peroxiredoxin [Candidatus Sedimenticola endophacoides]OQX32940.1 MAG: peroxiredoxin [Candidatus Sedimenticola endophacoides]OQX34741.1 MAG: peroxiredoxin [Candidatus Sedimenticola endophacoides]OQX40017.1 MAG: peroxiredoxin [Candidatus Sedimenticola endophacoides]OQX43336.1 MAG: peroxiredoxin [Candidatus Sedimenticola endophacoides]
MLATGDKAPGFELPGADLELTQLSDFIGRRNLVIYFYPKDDTPGCTMEAIDFSDLSEEFEATGTEIIGISMDNCLSHGAFRDKHGLTIRLLADIDGTVCQDYGVWQEREAHGEKRMGIVRSTFIIDRAGTVRHALYNVKPKGHAQAVLDLVRTL